ncbi:hypothetical protein Q4F19_17360 [Sphingomonas sp. BIUV-7]|uniref:Uncharacterized protein n=1 Tax=Sphingomonas natans TaxID=3063330 RepID=A0ABT8YEF2_9SPHN|nr:hypothetical protein [Sphingomonas sp. BIUV-7]MDO6416158.1 hypothetical protein [Sphingomonas sp. BIUV-7]
MRKPVAALALTLATPAATWGRSVDLAEPFVGTLANFGQLSPAAVAPYAMV